MGGEETVFRLEVSVVSAYWLAAEGAKGLSQGPTPRRTLARGGSEGLF